MKHVTRISQGEGIQQTDMRKKELKTLKIISAGRRFFFLGETMFFTSNLYEVFADVSIPVVSQLGIKLVRFAQINTEIDDSKDLLMYQPQGMEHSFSLKIHCALDKIGSGKNNFTLQTRAPVFQNEETDDTDSEDDGNYYG